jgi:hypothetical protein
MSDSMLRHGLPITYRPPDRNSTRRRNHEKPRNSPTPQRNSSGRHLSVRQQKLLEGLTVGKSARRAALDAGYSKYAAGHPAELLSRPALRETLCQMIAPIALIVQRINEGLDAIEIRTFSRMVGSKSKGTGRIEIQQLELVHWSERRKYAELAIRLLGLDPSIKHEQEDNVPQRMVIQWEVIGCPDCGSKHGPLIFDGEEGAQIR